MGLDTEADIFLDALRPANRHIVPAIRRLRHAMIAEHCGIEPELVSRLIDTHGSMAAAVEAASAASRGLGKRLEPFVLRPLTDTEKAMADSALLDPERPEELFEPIGRRRGLFRRGGLLRRPR
jgi:hypothetical protein